ncbi:pyridoxamine 5'-phosphate oxidase [Streptomyces armeniacus]|uniref:Pyridoxamine 5'-phosphate oxidase n=1 Tax=Streptomyces armeniacus TaxID=83291 RepID=A0A345Y1R4_9ACTN|nr:pyridoxamine 5'-phosphate oxidase family protein [Streptomyces armeniacus]AXK37830.1 pyridoxamine 5'-phosphate oxidase [Streptomyces armeniacus]
MQQRLGTTTRADRFYDEQVLDHLNERMREFTHQQEMFFLSTADRHGECDSSLRAGPPGFLRVLDERTLVYPEYRGNGVHASLGNIQENPHLGILMVDFIRARIGLHVNGTAELVEDEEMRALYPDLPHDPMPGRRAQLWVRVGVEEAYIHCAKHIPHLQKAPKRPAREWGTDDYKRKGGDFFGAARDARERGPVERPPREHDAAAVAAEAAAAGAPPVPAAPAAPPVPAVPAQRPAEPAVSAQPQPQSEPVAGSQPLPQGLTVPPVPPLPPLPPLPSLDGSDAPGVPEQVMWREEAERALAEAERRARAAQQSEPAAPFQGWFG